MQGRRLDRDQMLDIPLLEARLAQQLPIVLEPGVVIAVVEVGEVGHGR
jgi:hypothetical protein